jgi:Cofilin/tropomyosin-type actin-binding protein
MVSPDLFLFNLLKANLSTAACLWVGLFLQYHHLPLVADSPDSSLANLRLRMFLTAYRLSVHPDCIEAFNDLKLGKNGTKYIIYKISDDLKEVVVDEVSKEADYDIFREKLQNAKEKNGKSRPSYAVYDVAFDLDGGEGHRLDNTQIDMMDTG